MARTQVQSQGSDISDYNISIGRPPLVSQPVGVDDAHRARETRGQNAEPYDRNECRWSWSGLTIDLAGSAKYGRMEDEGKVLLST